MLKLVSRINEVMKSSRSVHDCSRIMCSYVDSDWKQLMLKTPGIPVFKLTVATAENYKLQLFTCHQKSLITVEDGQRVLKMLNGHVDLIDHHGIREMRTGDLMQTNRSHMLRIIKPSVFMQLSENKNYLP